MMKRFEHALHGVRDLLQEKNLRLHILAAVLVVLAGFFFRLNSIEWIVVIYSISAVLFTEGFNTAFERLCDHISPKYHEDIRFIKDMAAGSVFIASLVAFIAGLIVFLPKVF